MPAKKKRVIKMPISKEAHRKLFGDGNIVCDSFKKFALEAGSIYRYVVELKSNNDEIEVVYFFSFLREECSDLYKNKVPPIKDEEDIKAVLRFLIDEYTSLKEVKDGRNIRRENSKP